VVNTKVKSTAVRWARWVWQHTCFSEGWKPFKKSSDFANVIWVLHLHL